MYSVQKFENLHITLFKGIYWWRVASIANIRKKHDLRVPTLNKNPLISQEPLASFENYTEML